jgi:inorganic triphosphatase YgiF
MGSTPEIELKLAIATGRPADVWRRLSHGSLERADIDDTYFDTPAALLRQRGLVLRLRRDGDRWLQTLKAADRGANLVSERGEWEVALGANERRPALDPARFAHTPLAALMDRLGAEALAPVFRTRFTRRRLTVAHGASTIEIAVDDGRLIAETGNRAVRRPIAEVELELKAGDPADVLDLARKLLRKRGPVLVPALRSKAERGYALASGSALPVARAVASGFARLMRDDIGTAEALRAVVRHGLAIVVANADALREAPAIEHLHQARVALRRMRSAIRLLDPEGADVPRPLVSRLQKLAGVLGEARDWDVLVDTTLPALLASCAPEDRTPRELMRCARRLHARAIEAAVDAVASRRYTRLVLALSQWADSASPPSARLADRTRALLDPLADDVAAGARVFAPLSRRDRHRVRIHAKRLRYALDLLRFALPEKSTAAYVDALAGLQDTLGELNDAAVARERLARASTGRAARRAVKQWHEAVEPPLVAKAARELKALARRSRPWRSQV